MDLDLDEICIEESLLQALERSLTQLEMAFEPRQEGPMVYDLGPSTVTLSLELFDRLVDRCIVDRTNKPNKYTLLSSEDMDLHRMGLLVIKEENNGIYHNRGWVYDVDLGSSTTSAATHNVSITHLGRVILKLAGTMAIFESLIRQGFFAVLEALLPITSIEWLPELLSHKTLRVRKLATARLAQLEEE